MLIFELDLIPGVVAKARLDQIAHRQLIEKCSPADNGIVILEIVIIYGGGVHRNPQDYNDIEYIIIDGGSSDGIQSIIDQYKDRRAIFISERDTGIYEAMNKGLKIASGDIIGFLNSDDIYASEKVISDPVSS